jgi:hypothetical protein
MTKQIHAVKTMNLSARGGPWTNDMTSHTRHDDNWPTWSRPWCCQTRCRPPRKKRRKLKDPWVGNKWQKKGKEQNWTTLFDGGRRKREKWTIHWAEDPADNWDPVASFCPSYTPQWSGLYVCERACSFYTTARTCVPLSSRFGRPPYPKSLLLGGGDGRDRNHSHTCTHLSHHGTRCACGRKGGGNEKITK